MQQTEDLGDCAVSSEVHPERWQDTLTRQLDGAEMASPHIKMIVHPHKQSGTHTHSHTHTNTVVRKHTDVPTHTVVHTHIHTQCYIHTGPP